MNILCADIQCTCCSYVLHVYNIIHLHIYMLYMCTYALASMVSYSVIVSEGGRFCIHEGIVLDP